MTTKSKTVTQRAARRRALIVDIGTYSALAFGCVLALAPLVWGFLTSFKSQEMIAAYPPQWLPNPGTLKNYLDLLTTPGVLRFFANSAILSVGTILFCVLVATPAAYAAARLKFRGKGAFLLIILATSMIPGISILIPIYLLATRVDLLNSYAFLIVVYSAWMIPQAVWFIKGFIESVPVELEEAALIDGCSLVGIFVRIVMPLIKPGLAAVAILIFMFVWNDFLIAAALTTDESMRTAQVGLVRFIQDTLGVWWGQFMAFAMLAVVPVLAGFLLLQKWFVQGLTAGGVKG